MEMEIQDELPTLDERVELFLKAVYGERAYTDDERRAAREKLLDVMAEDITEELVVTPPGAHALN